MYNFGEVLDRETAQRRRDMFLSVLIALVAVALIASIIAAYA